MGRSGTSEREISSIDTIFITLSLERTLSHTHGSAPGNAPDSKSGGRTLGYGLAVVRGTGGTPEPFKNVVLPQQLRRQVQQAEQKVTMGAH